VIVQADARRLPFVDGCVKCVVTSPPYWQKRDYGHEKQIGAESSPEAFVCELRDVFAEVRRVLHPLGSLWLNLGDSYAAGGNGGGGSLSRKRRQWRETVGRKGWRKQPSGYKSKDLTLAPFLVAEALRRDGWYLRQVVIWWRQTANEPNRQDRPATSHEYVFLLSKSEDSSVRDPGGGWWSQSVWSIPPSKGVDGHSAPMPAELIRRCILAGTDPGDLVLDPFLGSGTVGAVAERLQRRWVGTDLSYHDLARERTAQRGLGLVEAGA
jgi:site-specific DNA-methyltransferase (cytosine-N4-specific)